VCDVLELRDEPYDGPVAQELVAAVQQEYVVRYGGPDESPVDPAEFVPPRGVFLVGYLGTRPVATGAIRQLGDGAVEIKRMFVVADCRGRGLSRQMLAALEARARQMGATRVVLETGQRQPEAMQLYETSGYERIDGFGYYCGAELSVSYGKSL
jgi:GNAT superfamily N-acetyltransferase